MTLVSSSTLFRTPSGRLLRYVWVLAVLAVATLLRAALDPLIHSQFPYVVYIASVVVATWLCGIEGGVVCTVFAAFAGNFFFVAPRYELLPHTNDWLAMFVFAVVALGLVGFVGWVRHAEDEVRRLHDQTATVLEQMPTGVVVANARGLVEFCNTAFELILGMRMRVGQDIASVRAERVYSTTRLLDGKHTPTDERPISRALQGQLVQDDEVYVTRPDGAHRVVSVSAAPIRASDGSTSGAVLTITDATERKHIEEQLRRREDELRSATLAAEVGVWTWFPTAGTVSVGANWRSLFDVPADVEVTFDTWTRAVHPGDRTRAVETLEAAWREHRQFAVEYRVLHRDGSVRWLIDRGRAAYDERGNATSMSGINIDITERKNLEDSLRDANRLKDEFLATLSHELRTPLNAIVGWSDMLRRGSLNPTDLQRATDSIYRNAQVQSELISDVLDVSRIISGKVRIEPKPMDVPSILRNAIESFSSAAHAKGVTLIEQIAPVPFPVSGDATRIQQVFWNLISNALKFTPAGGTVRVSLHLVDGSIQVKVTDTGIGIPADFLPHVFERFRQRDSSSTRTHGGLGLGLAIVKHLVELHGGTVSVESAGEGKGATFSVVLPARRFEDRRHETRRAVRAVPPVETVPDDLPSLCGTRVLIVDDERDAREVSATVLRHHGASVAVAATPSEALDQFSRFQPNVLLVDVAMPEMDGLMLLEKIRETEGRRDDTVPAIAFTAYAREEDRRRTIANGFQLHLAKPVDSHTLVRAVDRVKRRETGSSPQRGA